ncbi:hypothetical protein GCM10011452_29760 [Gemmobacter lanyuensis]|uniref:Uncharacterized protein n=1 Tax=Gemmobacter lanyuensis TaxID=1054497 RepID=A0A918IZ89_9RHOB|nr:hypothetical protein GCM10011452_29760 [Gemmobacter lanyuensis]
MLGPDQPGFLGSVDRADGLGRLVEGRIRRVDLDAGQKRGDVGACGKGVHQFLLDQVADHAFGLRPQHIQRPGGIGCEAGCLQRHQTDLGAVAMGHDDLVIARKVGQCRRRDADIGVLRLGRHRLCFGVQF